MSSETSASPEASRVRIARRVGSASAAKTELRRSTLSIAIRIYCYMAIYKSRDFCGLTDDQQSRLQEFDQRAFEGIDQYPADVFSINLKPRHLAVPAEERRWEPADVFLINLKPRHLAVPTEDRRWEPADVILINLKPRHVAVPAEERRWEPADVILINL